MTTTSRNSGSSTNPVYETLRDGTKQLSETGLSKREHFCLHMKVPDTGDEVLDNIIRAGAEREFSEKILAHIFINYVSTVSFAMEGNSIEDSVKMAIAARKDFERVISASE